MTNIVKKVREGLDNICEAIEFDVVDKKRKSLSVGDIVSWKNSKWKITDIPNDETIVLEPTSPSKQGSSTHDVKPQDVTKVK